jgi:hypothetical protein
MNQITVQETAHPGYHQEQRKNERYREIQLLVITGLGTGKILDIGNEGLSFGCLYAHAFPSMWSLDIIDAKGSHIKQLKVRKTWERSSGHPELSTKFELEVGVEFIDLNNHQTLELDNLLTNLEPIDDQCQCLL